MPFFAPEVTSEHDALASFLEHQTAQLRHTAIGLSDEEARRAHAPSALSIAGLLVHTAQVVANWLESARIAPEPLSSTALAELGRELGTGDAFYSGAEVADWSLDDLLAAYDRAVSRIRPIVMELDLDAPFPMPDSPWYPSDFHPNLRWVVLHLIAEVARHAGHADLVREAIDGEIAYSLNAKADGETFDWETYTSE